MSKHKKLSKPSKNNSNDRIEPNEAIIEVVSGNVVTTAKKDRSPYVWQRGGLDFKMNIREHYIWTAKQEVMLETMFYKNTRCVFIDGAWGTGKTTLAVFAALQMLNSGKCKGIKYIRNPIESSKSCTVGILPGSLEERLTPYMAPFWEKMDEFLCKGDIDKLEKDERIECNAVGMIRGTNWAAECCIVDEAVGLSWEDLLLVLSRAGNFTRVFVIGDSLNQNDLGHQSGFKRMFDLFSDQESKDNGVYTFELREEDDVLRSGFVKYIMKKCGVINTKPRISTDLTEPMFLSK